MRKAAPAMHLPPDAGSHHSGPYGYFLATMPLIGAGVREWLTHGPDLLSVGTFLGGAGTFLMGCYRVSGELRTWLDRRKAAR